MFILFNAATNGLGGSAWVNWVCLLDQQGQF